MYGIHSSTRYRLLAALQKGFPDLECLGACIDATVCEGAPTLTQFRAYQSSRAQSDAFAVNVENAAAADDTNVSGDGEGDGDGNCDVECDGDGVRIIRSAASPALAALRRVQRDHGSWAAAYETEQRVATGADKLRLLCKKGTVGRMFCVFFFTSLMKRCLTLV